MTMIMIARGWLVALAVALLAGATPAFAQEARLETQLATAVQHASFSMDADDHAMAVRHLGHVLNCIAGEDGEGFDGSWGHPCGGQGDGILVDIEEHPRHDDLAAVLRSVHALAMEGVGGETLGSVQAAAAGVRALLEVVESFGN